MVRIERWPSKLSPVVGPRLMMHNLDYVAQALAMSGFMKPWIEEKIKEHLLAGGSFQNKAEVKSDDEPSMSTNGEVLSMQVRSEWRMATEAEQLEFVDTSEYAQVTGKSVTKRAQETRYQLHYHEGPELIAAYESLPRQARVILDILNETERETFTEASIEMAVSQRAEELKTKQPPDRIWGFYRRRLVDEGHLEEISG